MDDDKNEIILEMWTSGTSASTIARKVCLTRSAVLGRIHRMRDKHSIKYRVSDIFVKTGRVIKPSSSHRSYRKERSFVPVRQISEPVSRILAPVEYVRPVSETSVSIMDLKSWHCRYVVGDPSRPLDRIYCGQPSTRDSYCGAHAEICYKPFSSLQTRKNQNR
jgi:GcrA cell cycle regulator